MVIEGVSKKRSGLVENKLTVKVHMKIGFRHSTDKIVAVIIVLHDPYYNGG